MLHKHKDKESADADAKDLAYLIAQKVNDPDVELFYGIVNSDVTMISEALKKGASQHITIDDVLKRHKKVLKGRK